MGKRLILLVLIAAPLAVWLPRLLAPGREDRPTAQLRLAAGDDAAGFSRAIEARPFELPLDHGPHHEYQTEWWYYTGNLSTEAGRHFGYQLTIFRRGLAPAPPPPPPGLSTNQFYFAHLALTDTWAGRHTQAERLSRGALGLAGADAAPYRVWVEDWGVTAVTPDGSGVRLQAREGDWHISLDLQATKPLVAHGHRGLSAKSQQAGNASYYVGYTRMATSGTVATPQGEWPVAGESWFDHEWSTSALGPGAVGWDWFSLQLSDGRELMLFHIRRGDGSVDLASGGTLVQEDGATRRLRVSDVDLGVLDTWRSPETGARYPSRWLLAIPSERVEIEIVPRLPDQEMRTSFVYWEGAVQLQGSKAGEPLTGHGYVELTGYARSMQGVF